MTPEQKDKRIAELEELVYAPGIMRCAKCAFQLYRRTLNVTSGNMSAGTSESEPCPNGCGPLWPITWKQHHFDYAEGAEKLDAEHRESIAKLEDGLGPFARFSELAKQGGITLQKSKEGWALTTPTSAPFMYSVTLKAADFDRAASLLDPASPESEGTPEPDAGEVERMVRWLQSDRVRTLVSEELDNPRGAPVLVQPGLSGDIALGILGTLSDEAVAAIKTTETRLEAQDAEIERLRGAVQSAMPHIDAEIEQRKTSGHDEDWAELQSVYEQLNSALSPPMDGQGGEG